MESRFTADTEVHCNLSLQKSGINGVDFIAGCFLQKSTAQNSNSSGIHYG